MGKIWLEVETESQESVQSAQNILNAIVANQNSVSSQVIEKTYQDWNWARQPFGNIKTKNRALEIIKIIRIQGDMGCSQIKSRLSESLGYQAVRNQLLTLKECGVLVKNGTRYALSEKAFETYEKCPI